MEKEFYTEEQKEIVGNHFAEILNIKRVGKYYYDTNYGRKNGLGIFNLIRRLNELVDNETPIDEIL